MADSLKFDDLNKVATTGLVINIIGNLFVIGSNWEALKNLKRRRL